MTQKEALDILVQLKTIILGNGIKGIPQQLEDMRSDFCLEFQGIKKDIEILKRQRYHAEAVKVYKKERRKLFFGIAGITASIMTVFMGIMGILIKLKVF